MRFTSSIIVAASAFVASVAAQDLSAAGYTGEIDTMDGGLEGTITVKDDSTLEVTGYTIEDASAPALYWWGSDNDDLASGFRISNAQVEESSEDTTLTIDLDAGHSPSEFNVVGLYCEQFKANFGQATLEEGDGSSDSATTSGSSSATESAAAASSTADSGSAGATTRAGSLVGVMAATLGFAVAFL